MLSSIHDAAGKENIIHVCVLGINHLSSSQKRHKNIGASKSANRLSNIFLVWNEVVGKEMDALVEGFIILETKLFPTGACGHQQTPPFVNLVLPASLIAVDILHFCMLES